MRARLFFHRLELNFWLNFDDLIQRSETVQYILPRVYTIITNQILARYIFPASIYAATGLCAGFILGLLSHLW
jgi:hypothetical protein